MKEIFSTKWQKLCVLLPALLFAFFMVFGRSFEKVGNWNLVFEGRANHLLAIIQFVIFFILFFVAIKRIFFIANNADLQKICDKVTCNNFFGEIFNKYFVFLEKFPMRTIFATFFIANLPYIILSYPALFMGDTPNQLRQTVFENAKLVGHHPLPHTLFIGMFVKLHSVLGWNKSIFLASLSQTFFLWFVIGVIFKILIEMKVSKKIVLALLVYYLFHPRIRAYQFLMTKDVLYSSFLTLFVIMLYFLVTKTFSKKRDFVFLGFAILGITLFRNDGKFIALISLAVAALFLKGKRKISLLYILFAFAINFGMTKIVFKVLDVEKGSAKEMLSVPFQQTARYVKYFGSEVTEEEKKTIDAVLDYGKLVEKYNPNLSDPVKNIARKNFGKNLKPYFKVWFKMFLKHPGIYIQATMNNYYQYFYPGKTLLGNYGYNWSATCMANANKSLKSDFHIPNRFKNLRLGYEALREDIFSLPIISIFRIPTFYSWIAILLIFFTLFCKNWKQLVCCVPIIVHFLILITAPVNGNYCRYQFPMFIYLPILIVMFLAEGKSKTTRSETQFS